MNLRCSHCVLMIALDGSYSKKMTPETLRLSDSSKRFLASRVSLATSAVKAPYPKEGGSYADFRLKSVRGTVPYTLETPPGAADEFTGSPMIQQPWLALPAICISKFQPYVPPAWEAPSITVGELPRNGDMS